MSILNSNKKMLPSVVLHAAEMALVGGAIGAFLTPLSNALANGVQAVPQVLGGDSTTMEAINLILANLGTDAQAAITNPNVAAIATGAGVGAAATVPFTVKHVLTENATSANVSDLEARIRKLEGVTPRRAPGKAA